MEITLEDTDFFKKLINCVESMTSNGNTGSQKIIFKEDCMSLQTMDTSKVCLIDIHLQDKFFGSYKVDKEYSLGINLNNLNNVIKTDTKHAMNIAYMDGHDRIKISFNENNKKNMEFDMNLSIPEDLGLSVVDFPYTTTVYIPNADFQKSIKDLSTFGNKCDIELKKNDLILTVNGDNGTGKISMKDLEVETQIQDSELKDSFSVKYLLMITKPNLSDEVVIKFADGCPFCLEYQLGDGYARFYLAGMVPDQ